MSEYYPGKFIRESDMIIENGELTLTSGQQWTSGSFKAKKGSIALLQISSNQRVYYRLLSVRYYNEITSNGTKLVEFQFGSDRSEILEPFMINVDGDFVIVLRLSVFNQIANIIINLELIGPRHN
ncbi:hypothetical protein ACNF40_06695 [Cuniculiplasma sp. SKW4]|uniref:hypothetical protein n=1 Tax=Cuniculiplasma sp. SKW4 TaxID=3400171 RepID=UPI003FD5A71D